MEPYELAHRVSALYLDENFSLAVETDLRRRGHFVSSVPDEDKVGASDAFQLLYASERNWTIITHNRKDFRLLHDAWLLWSHHWNVRQRHSGILVMEQFEHQLTSDIASVLLALLEDPGTALEGSLYEWRRSTGWVRFPG